MIKLKLCEHFNMSYIPFLKPTRNPFLYDSFSNNSTILNSIFYARQLALVTGISGSGKTSLINYSINDLDPFPDKLEKENPKN